MTVNSLALRNGFTQPPQIGMNLRNLPKYGRVVRLEGIIYFSRGVPFSILCDKNNIMPQALKIKAETPELRRKIDVRKQDFQMSIVRELIEKFVDNVQTAMMATWFQRHQLA